MQRAMASDGENRARVCSISPSSPPSAAGDGHRMVELELDAARALADLAQAAVLEGREYSGGSERARLSKSNPSSPSRFTHPCLVDGHCHEAKKASEDVMGERTKVQTYSGLFRSGINCPTTLVSYCGRRMKENLSEAEKEAKRTRRILANRESARQTIRRRQAFRDELTKKVADLSSDNEHMKTEKELIMKEYHSLKDTNKQLKEQIAETIRCKLEVGAEITSKDTEASTSFSTKFPLVVHNIPPLAPYILPSWPSISPTARSCYEEGNSSKVNGTSTPFCVPPCAWLYPLIHQASGYCPLYSHISKDRDEGTLHRQEDLSRCYEEVDDIYKTSICCGRKIDVPLSTRVATEKEEKVIRSNWKPSKFHAENQKLRSYPDGMVTRPLSFQTSNPSSIAKSEHITDVRDESKDKFDPVLQDKPLGACMYIHEKLVNANTAAKVRKRRKELMKLKHHLHGRDGTSNGEDDW